MKNGKMNMVTDLQHGSTGKGLINSYLAWVHKPELISCTNMANAGHCQSADTYIITNNGLEMLGDVVESKEATTSVNMNGEHEKIVGYYYDGIRTINNIILDNGISLKCTDIHSYYLWDIYDDQFKWVKSMDLDINRHVFMFPKEIEFTNNELYKSIEHENKPNKHAINVKTDKQTQVKIAEWLGLLVGNGYYNSRSRVSISFNEKQLDSMDYIEKLYEEIGITNIRKERAKNKGKLLKCWSLITEQVSGLREIFEIVGLKIAKKDQKTTPKNVLRSSKIIIAAYLRGLFDSDGSVKSDRLQLTNCSREVIKTAQQLLFILGINSTVKNRADTRSIKSGIRKIQYVLTINSKECFTKFLNRVDFLSDHKKNLLRELEAKTQEQGQIIKLSSESRRMLRRYKLAKRNTRSTAVIAKCSNDTNQNIKNIYKLASEYYISYISDIKRASESIEVFDLQISDTHSYIANGCISHNTSIMPDGKKFVAKAIPSSAILNGIDGYRPHVILGPSCAFTIGQLLKEIEECNDPIMYIHPRAGVITQEHADIENSLKGGTKHIASTMQGCGACLSDKIMRGPNVKLARDYKEIAKYVCPEDHTIESGNLAMRIIRSLKKGMTLLHEGSQGFGLDINHGSHYPHCTSRSCTVGQSMTDMGIPHTMLGDIYGVIRPYPIRVGNVVEDGKTVGHSGGCYSDNQEMTWEEVAKAAGAPAEVVAGELTTVTKRLRRVFSWSDVQFEQAVAINGANKICLNFANYIDWSCYGKNQWDDLGAKVHDWIKRLEDKHQVEVALVGTGPRVDQVCVRP